MKQVVIDCETTGEFVSEGHRLIEIAAVQIIDGKVSENYFHKYIDPQRAIAKEASEAHGINDAFVKEEPVFADIVGEFYQFLKDSDELLIHNAKFDVGFINNELQIMSETYTPIDKEFKIIDTLALARELLPNSKRNLDTLCGYFNIDVEHNENYENLWGALLDCRILADVYLEMIRDMELGNGR